MFARSYQVTISLSLRSSHRPGVSRVPAADLRPAQLRPECVGFPGAVGPERRALRRRRLPAASTSLLPDLLLLRRLGSTSPGEALGAVLELGGAPRRLRGPAPSLQHPRRRRRAGGLRGPPQPPMEPDIPQYANTLEL